MIISALASGALGAIGVGGLIYFRERSRLKRRRATLEHHLKHLQRLTSKLLNACDRLLKGDTPEETILYQRFKAHGGESYGDMQAAEVYEALYRSQQALNAAFDLHQKLIDPATQQNRSLEQRIWDWEMLYATLVGRSERLRNLTADELRTLLDPMLDASERAGTDVQLVRQLDDLWRELAGRPLKIKWQMIYPTQVEAEGILDYVDQIKAQIKRLPERHRQEAPWWLTETRSRRQAVETDTPSFLTELYQYIMRGGEAQSRPDEPDEVTPVELTGEQLFIDIDQRLAQMQVALKQERFLEVIEQVLEVLQDLETVRAFLRAMNDHGRRQAKIEAITAQGYRPSGLADDWQEIKTDVQTITQCILAGDYVGAAPWIEELNIDSQRALAEAQAWQALDEQNVASLDRFRDEIARIGQWWQDEVTPAWQTLQTYPQVNWTDVGTEMESAEKTLQQLREDQIRQIESLNSMTVQKFTEAERLLTYTTADLTQVERQFRTIVNRLAELQAAEAHIAAALDLTEADLVRAEALRNREDIKIGPEVDRQIEQARRQLAEAKRLTEASQFIAAMNVQATARQWATAAYVAADEQVRQINALQTKLAMVVKNAQEKKRQYLAAARKLPPVAQTASTNRLGWQLRDKLSEAEQARAVAAGLEDRALAQALQVAIEAYDEVGQLAEWTVRQVATDRQEYEEHLEQALTALAQAQQAIQQAAQVVRQSDASGAWWHALHRAQTTLPSVDATKQATKDALIRIRQQAEAAYRDARQAEDQARRKDRLAQARQSLQQPEQDERRDSRWMHPGDQVRRVAR